MVFSDTTNKNGILQIIEQKCDLGDGYITNNNDNLKYFTNLVNLACHNIIGIIHQCTKNWQYDDGSYSNLPSSTTNLVSGQSKYALPNEALTIDRVEVKDNNGNWSVLIPFVKENIGTGLDNFLSDDGIPQYYRLVGNIIEIYPASNYNQDNSLKIYYKRDGIEFSPTDTTKSLDLILVSLYQEIIPLKTSIDWLQIKQPNSLSLALFLNNYKEIKDELIKFYKSRFNDYKPVIKRITSLNSYK